MSEKTLRDEFAIAALNGFIISGDGRIAAIVSDAWALADAMMAKRGADEAEKPEDGWIAWAGGMCPVADDTVVAIRSRLGETATEPARNFLWGWASWAQDGDIVAYRVVTP